MTIQLTGVRIGMGSWCVEFNTETGEYIGHGTPKQHRRLYAPKKNRKVLIELRAKAIEITAILNKLELDE